MLALAALITSLVRWWVQGSNNLYTALDRRFYVPDPDLGWRVSNDTPIWLGLEVCAILAALAVGLVAGGWIINRRERVIGREASILRLAAWVVAAIAPAVPVLAFMSGAGPADRRDTLPTAAAVDHLAEGITGSLDLPPGRYEVVPHAGTSITAKISAGGEAFDARFAEEVHGRWEGDPRDLTQPMSAKVSVVAESVDTGINGRSKSAREYLQVDEFGVITFTLDQVLAATPASPDRIAFRALGSLDFIGKTLPVEISGVLGKPDTAALARLGLTGPVLIATATFSIKISETALVSDANDFDGDVIPLHVSLVLRHTGG